jgi:hypothetical protein
LDEKKQMTDRAAIQIETVADRRGIERFIRFPWRVYEGDPNWVPPILSEVRFLLSDKNPFFRHAEAAYFLARKGEEVVGRIAAIIDHVHIKFHNERAGFFGFFECLPDLQIAESLLAAASNWLKERGIEIMRGPMNPSINDECCFLLEGFDSPPMVMMTYNPPYYLDYMEKCGLKKAKDFYAYTADVDKVASLERLEKISLSVKAKIPGLAVRPVNLKAYDKEVDAMKVIFNSAFIRNWGALPMTDEEITSMAKRLKPLIVPELLMIAEVDGKPAGIFLALPDYNQVLKKLNGRLGLVGLLKFLWYSRKITDIRVLLLGVNKEYRKKGIDGLLYLESFRAATRKGYKRAEMSWVLEDNSLMQKGCELMGGKIYKKYRIYEKDLM